MRPRRGIRPESAKKERGGRERILRFFFLPATRGRTSVLIAGLIAVLITVLITGCRVLGTPFFPRERLVRFLLPELPPAGKIFFSSGHRYRIYFRNIRGEPEIRTARHSLLIRMGSESRFLLAYPEAPADQKPGTGPAPPVFFPAGSLYRPGSGKSAYSFRWQEGAPVFFLRKLREEQPGSRFLKNLNLRYFAEAYIRESPGNPWLVDRDFLYDSLRREGMQKMSLLFLRKKALYRKPIILKRTGSLLQSSKPITGCFFSLNLLRPPLCPASPGLYSPELPRGLHHFWEPRERLMLEISVRPEPGNASKFVFDNLLWAGVPAGKTR